MKRLLAAAIVAGALGAAGCGGPAPADTPNGKLDRALAAHDARMADALRTNDARLCHLDRNC